MNIRPGTKNDIPQVHALVCELAAYERAAHEVANTVEQMIEDGFGPHPSYGLFVAENEKDIVGIALYYTRYSTWKGRMLYLEDLVVKEAYRRNGTGGRLFEAVLEHARSNGFAGIAWQVLDWNSPAIEFYKKYDAHLDPEWINGKIMFDH